MGSTRPVDVFARTWKVWLPSGSAPMTFGREQLAKAAPSRLHSNVERPWSEENVKVPVFVKVVPIGSEVIVVCGAASVIVTCHVSVAGVGSAPFAFVARTWNVWVPTARPLTV
jgi:hypothetical protein